MIRTALGPLVDLVYPPRCPACGEGLAAQDGLCAACWAELTFPGVPACSRCQLPLEAEGTIPDICSACHANPPLYDGVAAGTVYAGVSKKLVLAFKYGNRIALAPMLARMIAARLPELEGDWLVVPVPLHPRRLWRRGFNQSALLARSIARLCDQKLLVDGLVRRKQTQPLGDLGRDARARELAGAIAVKKRHRSTFDGAQVILVDDVLTSGATVNACVSVMREAGASKVLVACFARTLG